MSCANLPTFKEHTARAAPSLNGYSAGSDRSGEGRARWGSGLSPPAALRSAKHSKMTAGRKKGMLGQDLSQVDRP
eukprot:3673816-Rhodomonas_salina.4